MMNRLLKRAGYVALALMPVVAMAGEAFTGKIKKAPLNIPAITMFFAFVCSRNCFRIEKCSPNE